MTTSTPTAGAGATTSDRRSSSRKGDGATHAEAVETNSIVFEWPLYGLKQMFDSSRSDTKSKVVKSTPFGAGRWTVLFYAQSGHEQFCSLYLNAEPLPHERIHPLLAGAESAMERGSPASGGGSGGGSGSGSGSGGSGGGKSGKGDWKPEDKWYREGLFRFTFNIQTLDKGSTLGTKEAHDHAFCFKTSNWGWAQFAKRDTVFYNNAAVRAADAFLISVTIQSSPEKPRLAQPAVHTVPPVLIQAMGSLLDDAEHSDIVFYLSSRRRSIHGPRRIYAIKKILAARSEYFRDMFEGGFLEAEQEEDEDGEGGDVPTRPTAAVRVRSTAHPQLSHEAVARSTTSEAAAAATFGGGGDGGDGQDDDEGSEVGSVAYGPEILLEDSDEEVEEEEDVDGAVAAATSSGSPSRLVKVEEQQEESTRTPPSLERDTESVVEDDGEEEGDEEDTPEEDQVMAVAGGAANAKSQKSSSQAEDAARAAGDALGGSADAATMRGDASEVDASGPKQEGNLSAAAGPTQMARSPTRPHGCARTANAKRGRSVQGEVQPSSEIKGAQQREKHKGDRRKRRKVVVRDAAYPTFKALLFFLYTDTVEFAPLTSSFLPVDVANNEHLSGGAFGGGGGGGGRSVTSFAEEMHKAHRRRQTVIDTYCQKHPGKPSPCSAKAMYKLADKLQIPDLKKRAQEHIASSLTVANITFECFSSFATRYPDIRKMETDFLLRNWRTVKSSAAMKTVFSRGVAAHPGLADVWPHLLECLEYRPPGSQEDESDADAYER